MSFRETVKNSSIFSLFTVISRMLGLVRDMMKAYAFGTGYLSVAFDIAFRLPNMLRNLVAEGALAQSFIPLYEQYKTKDGAEKDAAGAVLAFTIVLLSLASVAAWFILPHIVPHLMNDAAMNNPATRVAVPLSQLLFPYIVIISISSLYMSIQYSHGIFWAGSMGPALLNAVILVVFGIYFFLTGVKNTEPLVYAWSWSILAAALLQLVFQWQVARKHDIAPRYSLNFRHPVIRGLFVLMLPAVFASAAQEIGQLIDIFLATSLSEKVPGAVSALTYSHRLIMLPMGIFGVAVATASLPQLSRMFKEGQHDAYRENLVSAARLNLFLLLPSMLGLSLASEVVVKFLFERGAFDARSSADTAYALFFYAFGIPGYSLQKLFMSGMYARRNTRAPAMITVAVLVFNLATSIALMPWLNHGGLALGSSLAAYLGMLIYLLILRRHGIRVIRDFVRSDFLRIYLINLLLAVIILLLLKVTTPLPTVLRLAGVVLPSLVFYLIAARIAGVEEMRIMLELPLRLKEKLFGKRPQKP